MDLMNLIILTRPEGMWQSILLAFNSVFGSYVWAVIVLAVIVRVIFLIVDVINKRVSFKTASINEKMQPELDAIAKKYANDKNVLQQKQQEVYKKYQSSLMGSCIPMLVILILQTAVFLTLWTGLRSIANYNIASQYENTKTVYYNALLLNEDDDFVNEVTSLVNSGLDVTYEIKVDLENNTMTVTIGETSKDVAMQKELTNAEIMSYIEAYAKETEDTPLDSVKAAFKAIANDVTADYYEANMESFLWIKNIYKSETATSPVFTESEVLNYLESYYEDAVSNGIFDTQEEADAEYELESSVFAYVVAGLNERDMGVNGYYILVIIAVLSSFLQIFVSNKLNKKGSAQSGGKAMYIIMPIIYGIFTLMYTSLFAIYIIAGQIIMIALSPLSTLIVRKWSASAEKKEKAKNYVDVDYRRK